MTDQRSAASWLYDDLLAWLSPGGLLLTALALRFPRAERLERSEGLSVPAADAMSVHVFHDVDRRMREYLEAVDPSSRPSLNRMKVLCSLSCNSAAACVVFIAVDALAGNAATWTVAQGATACLCTGIAFIAAVYRERRRQRTQLSIWRRVQVVPRA
jgi:GAF domain-containing protein